MAWQRMTQSPDPATAGKAVTICYDLTEAWLPITLTVIWHPSEDTYVHAITSVENACFTVIVPEGSTGGLVEDGSYQSYDLGLLIQ